MIERSVGFSCENTRCDEIVGFEMPIKLKASFRFSVICKT